MPAKPSPKTTPFNGYVQINLSETDEQTILADKTKLGAVLELLVAVCQNGYALAFKPLVGSPGFKVTLQDQVEQRGSYGYMLSGEAPDIRLAALVLYYKHQAMMNGEWTPFCSQTRKTTGLR